MTTIYRVASTRQLHHSDPLHWANFYPEKQRVHRRKMQERQDLILYIANLHAVACDTGMPLGMIHIPMRLMSLRDWVQDFHVVLDKFFSIVQLGYNLGEGNHELSILVPLNVQNGKRKASDAAKELQYAPPERSDSKVVSKVYIHQERRESILHELKMKGRLDLLAPVQWLLERPEVNFHFDPAGKLRMRDTSVWPVPAVETWPSWLREQLFGQGLDIDSAYTQFLLFALQEAYKDAPTMLQTLYPDLLRSVHDKAGFRRELCVDVMGLEHTIENIGIVKQICMSLANGSRISPAILQGARSYSDAAEMIVENVENIAPTNLARIAKRFESISRQYTNARKTICSAKLRQNPTRQNLKKVFNTYFEWERDARYAIWNLIGKHGVMVHDGIDGVPQQYLNDIPSLIRQLGIKLTA